MTVPSTRLIDCCSNASDLIPFDFEHIVEPFEGPEKTLEIEFSEPSHKLRAIPRHIWDQIITDAGATIMDVKTDAHGNSYILSESSLFVFEDRVVIKTCGTTTLLNALPKLTQACNDIGLEMSWITYSRKNFLFPHDQREPHKNFNEETSYLSSHVPLTIAQSLGPEESDHMFLCTSKIKESTTTTPACTLTMMMYGLHPTCSRKFAKSPLSTDGPSMTTNSGIRKLFPTALIHEWAFDPCGYSMNALLEGGAYATVHVTPQQSCSYASFETNLTGGSYKDIIDRVLEIFHPRRFTLSIGSRGKWVNEDPVPVHEKMLVTSSSQQVFVRECVDQVNPDVNRSFFMANYVLQSSGNTQ